MATLRFVKGTKYQNYCAECNRPIPIGSNAWWNGQTGAASKNFHEDCRPADLSPEVRKANRERINASSNEGDTKQGQPAARNFVATGHEAAASPAFSPEENLYWALNVCGKSAVGVDAEVVAELMRERYGMWSIEAIQKNKLRNLGAIR